MLSDIQAVKYTPDTATEVDLSCDITSAPEDAVEFETVDVPTLCNPQGSTVKVGARTLTLELLWNPDDWDTRIEPLFGTSGSLDWHIDGADGAGYTYEVSWPSTYGIAAPLGESVVVEIQLGVASRVPLAAA